jgi:paraquat-inducible protein B
MLRRCIPLIGTISLALYGCNNAKPPEAVASDVAKAEQKADVKVDDKIQELNNKDANGVYGVQMAAAEGDHKVALAQCNALAGTEQKDCKNQADANYNLVKAQAKAEVSAAKQ